MILEVLYFATAISVASQQESFEQQDERERQYEYESRYYSKPEDTRSAVGKFTFVKVKGEIRNDDKVQEKPLLPSIIGRTKLVNDVGLPFPFSFIPFDPRRPFFLSPLPRLLSQPVMSPDFPFISRPHQFFETATNRDGHFVAISKIFGGLSFRGPDYAFGPPGTHSGDQLVQQEESWSHFFTPVDRAGTPSFKMPNQETHVPKFPTQDGPGRFFLHTPYTGSEQHGVTNENDPQNQNRHYQDSEQASGSSATQEQQEKPSPLSYPVQDNPAYFQRWPEAQSNGKGKETPKLAMSFPPSQELDHFECHCRPFIQDWSRLKRCFQTCSSKRSYGWQR